MENTETCTHCAVNAAELKTGSKAARSSRLCYAHWLELMLRYERMLASDEAVAHDDLVALFTEYGVQQAAAAKKLKAVKDILAS